MNENDKWYWETLNMGNPPTGTTDTKITGHEILNAINNVANVAGNPLTGKEVQEILKNPSTAQVSQDMLNAANKVQQENNALQDVDKNNLPGGIFEDYYNTAQNQNPNDKVDTTEQISRDFYNMARQAGQGINDQNQWYIGEIAGAKNLYNSAKDDVSRQNANDYANYIRQLAQMRGVNLGQWGDGGSLSTEQSNLALGNYALDKQEEAQEKFKTLQDDLQNKYGYNSQQYFDERYDYYRSKGIGHNRATILAGRETLPYQKERTGFLQNAIDEYGIDDGTTLNQFGVSVLGKLADEDNITGTAYANAYAKPLNEYTYQQNFRNLMATQEASMAKELARQRADMLKTIYTQGAMDNRNNANIVSKEKIAEAKEQGLDKRFNVGEENKFKLEKMKQENRIALEKIKAELAEISELRKSSNSGKTSNNDKETYTRLKDLQNQIYTRLKDAKSDDEPDEEYISELSSNLKRVDELLRTFQDPALNSINYPEATGNPNEDMKVIAEIMKNGGTSNDIRVWGRGFYDANTLHKMIDRFSR